MRHGGSGGAVLGKRSFCLTWRAGSQELGIMIFTMMLFILPRDYLPTPLPVSKKPREE